MIERRTREAAASPPPGSALRIRELDERECREFLATCRIGRIAFMHRNRIDIEPIRLTLDAGWLFGRTSSGTKLSMLRHHPWVAVEVDRIEGDDDWTSVVVHGAFHELGRSRVAAQAERHARAMAAVQRESPDAFTDRDPTPWRSTLFGISVDDITGRQALPR